MRKEIENWWEQAQKDFEVAEKLLHCDEYYASAFFCQQAVEKALKATFIKKNGKSPGQTHSLIYLGTETKIPHSHFSTLQSLTSEFIMTRYPDVAGEAPYKLYNKEKVAEYITKAREILLWVQDQIYKQ